MFTVKISAFALTVMMPAALVTAVMESSGMEQQALEVTNKSFLAPKSAAGDTSHLQQGLNRKLSFGEHILRSLSAHDALSSSPKPSPNASPTLSEPLLSPGDDKRRAPSFGQRMWNKVFAPKAGEPIITTLPLTVGGPSGNKSSNPSSEQSSPAGKKKSSSSSSTDSRQAGKKKSSSSSSTGPRQAGKKKSSSSSSTESRQAGKKKSSNSSNPTESRQAGSLFLTIGVSYDKFQSFEGSSLLNNLGVKFNLKEPELGQPGTNLLLASDEFDNRLQTLEALGNSDFIHPCHRSPTIGYSEPSFTIFCDNGKLELKASFAEGYPPWLSQLSLSMKSTKSYRFGELDAVQIKFRN